jgi:hypothetical protein
LPLIEAVHPGAFDRADVDEDVVAAFIRLNESEAFWPLNHLTVPVMGAFLHRRVKSSRALTRPVNSRFWKKVVSQARRSRRGQVVRPKARCRLHTALLLLPQVANGVYSRKRSLPPAFTGQLEHFPIRLRHSLGVMRGLDPRIHPFFVRRWIAFVRRWIAGSSPAMTGDRFNLNESCSTCIRIGNLLGSAEKAGYSALGDPS